MAVAERLYHENLTNLAKQCSEEQRQVQLQQEEAESRRMVARLAPQRSESSSDDNGYTVIGNGNSDMAANGHGPPTETTRLLPTTSNGSGPSTSVWCGNGGYNAVPSHSNLMQRFSWALGVALATISGFIFCANNFLIQYYEIGALEILLVRSALQVNIVGVVAGVMGTRMLPGSFFTLLCVSGQAVISTIVVYLSYRCLVFLPLGDAMVIIFTAPLFTVILSLLCFRIKIGLWKAGLCAVLFAGMILNIQPPFIFPTEIPEPGAEATLSETRGPVSHSDGYYIGVFMALGCSLSGALKSIIIKYVSKDFDTVALMFYMGFGGVFTIFAIASVDMGVNHLVEQLQMADAERWGIIVGISALGMLGYFTYVASLNFVSATTCTVAGTFEIVLAYGVQIIFMGVWPNAVGIFGALLVFASVVGIALEERNLGNNNSSNQVRAASQNQAQSA